MEEESLALDEKQLQRVDSEFALSSSGSGISSVLSFEDLRSITSGSGDISSASSGSGEILPTEAAILPPLLRRTMSSDVEAVMTATAMSVREKCVGKKNKGVSWGQTSVIGRRKEMEDAVSVIPGFMSRTCRHVGGCTAPGSQSSAEISPLHFFGVYDGHGGSQRGR